MKEFFIKYFKEILLTILIGVVVFLLIKVLTPPQDKSDLLKYKLKQLDIQIDSLKSKQKMKIK